MTLLSNKNFLLGSLVVALGFCQIPKANAVWEQGPSSQITLPKGNLVQDALTLPGKKILLVQGTLGEFYRVEPEADDPLVFSLTSHLKPEINLEDAISISGQDGMDLLILSGDGQLGLGDLNGLDFNYQPIPSSKLGRIFMVRPITGSSPNSFMALAGIPNRPELLKLVRNGQQIRIDARGRLRLPGAALEMLALQDPKTGEDKVYILAENKTGKIHSYPFTLNEGGLRYLGGPKSLTNPGASATLVPCDGAQQTFVLFESHMETNRPFQFRLVDNSLAPLSSHTPLALQTRHHLFSCSFTKVAGPVLELLSETGTLRQFFERPFRLTVRGESLTQIPPPQKVGSAWYSPLKPLAAALGLRINSDATKAISITYRHATVKTRLKQTVVETGGQKKNLARPLLMVSPTGEGTVDLETLWPLLGIPTEFSTKGPVLHLWPQRQDSTP